MKYLIIVLLLSGCASLAPKPFKHDYISQQVGGTATAGVGETFFTMERMYGEDNNFGTVFKGEAAKFELEVKGVTKDKLQLEYSEYMKPVAGYGYSKDEPWLKKQAFNKTLEFDLKESKTVEYKGYVFKIVTAGNNKVTFQRTK